MEKTLQKLNLEFCGKGLHKIKPEDLLKQKNAVLLDVRSRQEAQAINFDFSGFGIKVINIPIDQLPQNLEQLPKGKLIITFCSAGTRAAWAYLFLSDKNFNAKWFDGGITELVSIFKPSKFL